MPNRISLSAVGRACGALVLVAGAGFFAVELASLGVTGPSTIAADAPSALASSSDDPGGRLFEPKRIEVDSAFETAQLAEAAESTLLPSGVRIGDDRVDSTGLGDADRVAKEEPAQPASKQPSEADTETMVKIFWPEDGARYKDEVIVFEGEAEPGATVTAGPYEADMDAAGNWRIQLVLSPGANRAVISVEDEAGNVAEDSVTVWLDVEEPAEPTVDPQDLPDVPLPIDVPKVEEKEDEQGEPADPEDKGVEFHAEQAYGSCAEEVPYDVFWGTATPGTFVEILSPFGSATIEVDSHGHWEKKVYFEIAPRGVPFEVHVVAANGSKTFTFVAEEFEEEPKDPKD